MTWVCDYGGNNNCCAARQGMSLTNPQHHSKMESRSNRGLFLDLYLRTVSAGSRGRPNELDSWHQSMNRLNGQNPPQYHQPIEQDAKVNKKDKSKWSLGGFFRRRKKEDSDSSSGCEEIRPNTVKKGFLSRRLRNKRQNAGRLGGAFDHVVATGREQQVPSDHSIGSNVGGEIAVRSSRESLASAGTSSLESHTRRRKERVKARAEALRDRLKNDSSSDEDETSPGSSSVSRFRSEDSLHGSLPRRGRLHNPKRLPKNEDGSYSLNLSAPHLRNSYSSSSVANSASVASPRFQDDYTAGHDEAGIMHVQLPIGLHHRSRISRAPPPPPPRDPNRKYLSSQYDASRPLSYAFENDERSHNMRSHSSSRIAPIQSDRCNSEDHIAMSEQWRAPNYMPDRPSSVSVEAMRPQVKRFITRHPSENDVVDAATGKRYKYFADQTPRSRKPILATPFTPDMNYDAGVAKMYRPPPINKEHRAVRSASDFWKMKDQEEASRRIQSNVATNQLKIYKPAEHQNGLPQIRSNVLPRCTVRDVPLKSEPHASKSSIDVQKREPPIPPLRKYTPNRTSSGSSAGEGVDAYNGFENKDRIRPKSTNLEDALSELEAIYKSLKLSDENLLDRAERLDVTTPVVDKKNYMLDGTFHEKPHMRLSRRSTIPDKLMDDMAYRRLHPKERQSSQESMSPQISYLSSSPLASRTFEYNTAPSEQNGNEPDITLDDVVYRNVRHANHSLKVKDPQPLFGIPIGPVVPGANSDYLHAAPKNTYRLRFMPRKSPDIVSDDLAYRNLRKDQNRNSALPPIKPITDDMHLLLNNNNIKQEDLTNTSKKKRAVRSMSANVYNLLHQHMQSLIDDDEQDFEKAQSLSNVNGAVKSQSKTLPPGAKLTASDIVAPPIPGSISRSPTSTETLTSSRNDMNSMKSLSKLTNEIENDYLTALAQRAKDTTEKIDKELRELRGDISVTPKDILQNGRSAKDISSKLSDTNDNGPSIDESPKPVVNSILKELDAVSEKAKQCQNKLESAVNEQQKLGITASTTYSLIPTVDSGHTTDQSDIEQVDVIDNSENMVFTSVASLLENAAGAGENVLDGSKFSDLTEKCKFQLGALQNYDNDYDNVPSTILELGKIVTESEPTQKHQTAPIGSEMKHKKALLKTLNDESREEVLDSTSSDMVSRRINDINANETKINEITNSIQNNILSISELLKNCEDSDGPYKSLAQSRNLSTNYTENKLSNSPIPDFTYMSKDKNLGDEIFVEAMDKNPTKSSDDSDTPDYANVPSSRSKTSTVTIAEMEGDTSEYNSAEELAMIFGKDGSKSKSSSPPCKSPELQVKGINDHGKAQGDSQKSSGTSSKNSAGNGITKHDSDSSGGPKVICENQNAPTVPWYSDPRQLIIICAYGLACVQQFSGLDLFVLLSILLAVISVIAMLLI